MKFCLSVIIPIIGDKPITETIQSIAIQEYEICEVLIVRNGQEFYKSEKTYFDKKKFPNLIVKQIGISDKGKAKALNVGLHYAKFDIVAIIDADCVVEKNAFHNCLRHFNESSVIAVSGILKTIGNNGIIGLLQKVEYEKVFAFTRRLFNCVKADCLISGAFGFFRKEALIEVRGYSEDTVGEDMDVVLKLQKKYHSTSEIVFVYEKDAVCYTQIPVTIKHLMHQRERWQRGLFDCLLRHKYMIFNPKYGLLGFMVLPYEIIVELLASFFVIIHIVIMISAIVNYEMCFQIIQSNSLFSSLQSWWIYGVYVWIEILLSIVADYDSNKKMSLGRSIKLCFITIVSMLWSVPLSFVRIYGMVTFHRRKMVW